VDPAARLTLDGILEHPWIQRHTPRPPNDFSPAHLNRLRLYALRRRVKVAARVAAFGVGHLQKARDLRAIVSAQHITPADFSSLSSAFHRACSAATPPGEPLQLTVDFVRFRGVLASVAATAPLPAERIFRIFDTGELPCGRRPNSAARCRFRLCCFHR
jgi:hypothetical protein